VTINRTGPDRMNDYFARGANWPQLTKEMTLVDARIVTSW